MIKVMNYSDWLKLDKTKLVCILGDWATRIVLNANDIFSYACSASVEVDIADIYKLVEVYTQFGDDGVLAFMAKLKDQDILSRRQSSKYHEAKKYLKDWEPFENHN